MSSCWLLLAVFCCLLSIAQRSSVTARRHRHRQRYIHDLNRQYHHDLLHHDPFHHDEISQDDLQDDAVSGRPVQPQHRLSAVDGAVPPRATLTRRSVRPHHRRRKKPNDRRGRGEGGRVWRRRGGGASISDISAEVFRSTVFTAVDTPRSTTPVPAQPPSSNFVDFVTRSPDITNVTVGGDVLVETIGENGDDMVMIETPDNGTMITFADINERGT